MTPIQLCRHDVSFQPESARVIIRPFIPGNSKTVAAILNRATSISEEDAATQLASLREEFSSRHFDIESILLGNYEKVRSHIAASHPLTRIRQLLIGALFSGEYALESAALFNPSIVPHPDQTGVPEGGLRFIMSLRATGEGHISSIEFRAGIITPDGGVVVEPVSRFVAAPEVVPNPTYKRKRFLIKLQEMGLENGHASAVIEPLAEDFTLHELDESMRRVRREMKPVSSQMRRAMEVIRWLAESNYELNFSPKLAVSERIIFPVSPNESNGIEDARFVRFTEDDGTVMYRATYTAYNGRVILPQLIETPDFLHFQVLTLNGNAVQNKGMALFPRRINGRYAMLSRQDDENIYIMFSDYPHYWNTPQLLMRPAYMWESVKIGNCGSPIETKAGWLVITHGVGPMRKYCIGAALLDLNDPSKVIGRLKEPLLSAKGNEREGYVPNVVYSCGSLIHRGKVILPYAMSDKVSLIASVSLQDLLTALTTDEVPQVTIASTAEA
jgi:predicted GH43/DUF377 family glycosyl hydrolase